MSRILAFGNSGSGKTTLANRLRRDRGLAHLDLDTLAWLPGMPPQRRPLADSDKLIRDFTAQYQHWVIEGCYADLLDLLASEAEEIVFLKLPEQVCVLNARSRPLEPAKYSSKAEQDGNLSMLIQWIQDYPNRDDPCSLAAHEDFFESFSGKKALLISNTQSGNWQPALRCSIGNSR